MSVAGRKPTPTHLKVLRGNPGKRAITKDEPQPEPLNTIPSPPAHLPEGAREEWARVFPMLQRIRVITEADLSALAAYCQAYGRWVEAENHLKENGLVVMTPNKFLVQSPYLAIANKAMEQMHKFMVEFGMTPSSRARVKVTGTGTLPPIAGVPASGNKFLTLHGKASKRSA